MWAMRYLPGTGPDPATGAGFGLPFPWPPASLAARASPKLSDNLVLPGAIMLDPPAHVQMRAHAEGHVAADERDLGDHRRLQRECAEVFGFEVVDVLLPAGAGEHLGLERERVQEVLDPLGR